ncbi:NCS2 family permease [Enterococcus sp. BWR-S5]|uniref:NCS2 family permease n=1 Tax=Enterococcus sp. BWR-S5 TaxID=2787714 RepID=UPI001921CE25|nr:NCS2 family permease [Enterococcus sp. BWR-S5]MBL1225592.1 NCS2 family permease [Enterococcus sp. BWR-S5]
MKKFLESRFHLEDEQTTVRKEVLAGITTFVAISYIIAVNGSILSMAGMSYEWVTLSTALTAFIGCMLMAFVGNSPLVVVPGMGDNAFFVFVLVASFGLTWQQALAATLIAGVLFLVIANKKVTNYLIEVIPKSMIAAMSGGIGMFIAFLGFKNSGIIIGDEATFVRLADLREAVPLAAVITLIIMVILFLKNIKGNFLIGIILGTLIAAVFGLVDFSGIGQGAVSFSGYSSQLLAFDFSAAASFNFWIAVFSLTMMIVFQNMGAQLSMLPEKEKFPVSFRINALSVIISAILGTCATTSAAENAAGLAVGGRTGLTSFVAGILFLPAILLVPLFRIIPQSAISPVLIIVGCLMVMSVKDVLWGDFSEAFPAYLMMVIMPLSFNVANGLAFGFIAYPLVKCVMGKSKEVKPLMYLLSALFLIYFILGSG